MRARAAVLSRVLASRSLRRVALAFAAFAGAEYAVWTAMLVYAYRQGGTTTAGLIAVVQLVPAALVAAPAATIADRRGGAFALELGYVLQAAAMAGTAAVLLAGAPAPPAYVLAAVAASAVTISRPAQAAFIAALAQHPDELTAATALSSWIDSISALLGPAVAGLLIAFDGPGLVFGVFAVAVGAGAWLVAGIGSEGPAAEQPSSQAGGSGGLLEGLAVLRWQPDTRALLGMFAVGYLAWGTLDVLAVVLALGVLELGGSGAGYLTAAFGGGAVLGGMGALALVGAPTLALPLAVAALGWAVAFAVLGLWPTTVGAFLLLLAAGVSNAVMDVSGRTLLARAAPSHVLARVFGVLEGLSMAALAVGAALVPVLVSVGGARLALIGVAAILALAVPLALPRLRALDRRGVAGPELALLRGHELFAALPAPALEGLAHDLVAVDLRAGEVVIRQGDVGDRFYLVDTGRLEVTVDGVPVATLGAGAGFGEIALIHDVPRTAAVTALSECRLYALAREPFRDALVPAV